MGKQNTTRNYRDDGKGDVSCNILLLYYRSGKLKDHDLNRSSTTVLRFCSYFLHYVLAIFDYFVTVHSTFGLCRFLWGPVQVRFRSHYLKFGLQVLLMEEILPTWYV